MSPYQCLYGRSPLLPIELTNLPTRQGLTRPDLTQRETPEQRESRHQAIHEQQSMAKAQILGASIVQRRNFVEWNRNRKTRTSDLRKGDLVLMRRPGVIKGHRFRWEGPYLFVGWAKGLHDKKGILRDNRGRTWARNSRELFRYFPRIELVREYLQEISAVDGVRPLPRLVINRLLEPHYVPQDFLSIRLANAIKKVRKLHGFVTLRMSS